MELLQFARYLEVERGLRPATVSVYSREVRFYVQSTGQVRRYIASRGGSPSTVTKRLAAIRAFARFQGRKDPTLKIDRPKRRLGLPRPVPDWSQRLADADPLTRATALFLVETGLRISEACSISCDLPPPEELLVKGKGGKERLLPLSAQARAALSFLGGRIPWSARTVQRRFQSLGFTPHRLRHQFGCDLAASGADLGEIQDLMGHSSPATTRTYTAYATDRLRRALERRSHPE